MYEVISSHNPGRTHHYQHCYQQIFKNQYWKGKRACLVTQFLKRRMSAVDFIVYLVLWVYDL